jgi:tetratricopeptide (TPR) repeat protein
MRAAFLPVLLVAVALLPVRRAGAQMHGVPGRRPSPGELLDLDSAISRAAMSVGPAVADTGGLSVSCGLKGDLLDDYACHMMAACLQEQGVEARTCAASLNGAGDKLPPELPVPLVRYLLSRGDAGFVHVETRVRRGERQLVIGAYDGEAAALRTSMTVPFRVPEGLAVLLAGDPKRLKTADAKWLVVLREAFGYGDGARNPGSGVEESRAAFLFSRGLWSEAAPRLEQLAGDANGPVLMEAAFAYQQAGERAKARALVESALRRNPDSGPLWCLRSWLSLRRGSTEDALVYLEEARIWGMAREGIYRFARGLIALEQGDAETAERELIRAAELLADREFAPLELARFYRDRAQMPEATIYYRKATNAADPSAETWGELAVALETAGDLDGAADALRNAFQLDSANVTITRYLANVLRQTGKYQEALRVLERAATANPLNGALLAAYGDCAAAMWKVDVALQAFQESIDAVGELPYSRMRLAAMSRTRREYRKAREILTELIAREPEYYPARIELGRLLAELGRFQEAASTLEAATVHPDYEAQARLVLVDVYLATERYQEAVECSQIAAAALPDDVTYAKLAEAFAAAGELAKAERAARTAVEKDARSAVARVALGRVLLARGDLEAARECTRQAVALDPFWIPALDLGGAVQKARGEFHRAAEFWRRAVTLDPWNAEIHRELSDILGPELDDWTATEEHLKKYVELEKMRAEASI